MTLVYSWNVVLRLPIGPAQCVPSRTIKTTCSTLPTTGFFCFPFRNSNAFLTSITRSQATLPHCAQYGQALIPLSHIRPELHAICRAIGRPQTESTRLNLYASALEQMEGRGTYHQLEPFLGMFVVSIFGNERRAPAQVHTATDSNVGPILVASIVIPNLKPAPSI